MSALDAKEGRLTEWLLRSFALITYVFAVGNLASGWWLDPSRVTLLLLLLTEGYTLLLVLLARRADIRDMTPLSVIATIYAVFYLVLLNPQDTIQLIPEWGGVALQTLGALWQFSSKVFLGRSFGLLPAQRGLVMSGPYRIVRHPIYLGYLVSHVGFLLSNFSWRNAAVLALLYVGQLHRIHREEKMLAADSPAYRDYRMRVRWRLLPFIY